METQPESKSRAKRLVIQQDASLEECDKCHASIWRYKSDGREVAVEAASFEEHSCWITLPEGADFISTD